MTTIRRRGGLLVATAALCVILLSATTIEQVGADAAVTVANSLRGRLGAAISSGEKASYSVPINSRLLEEGEGEEGGEKNEAEDEKEEEQQQQYQEGNNNDGDDQEEQNEEAEHEEQQEEEMEEDAENDNEYANDDGNGNGNDDQADFSTNVQDTVADEQDKFQDLMDRFDEDVMNMWSTSPSQWDGECWKVFAGVGGAFAFLLSCIFYLCCKCCNGDITDEDRIIAAQAAADKRAKKKLGHRGRLFARMRNTDDAETVASHQTGLTDLDDERPFVLIEDVEKNTTMDYDKSKSTAGMDGLSSPVYARSVAQHENVLGPTEYKLNDFSNKHPVPGASAAMSLDDAETLHSRGTFKSIGTFKSLKSQSERKPHGIINETVDVWSEFLGFKKHNHKFKPGAHISKDEDEDINLTDDEMSRRRNRRSSTKKRRGRSSIPVPPQIKAGVYTRPVVIVPAQQENDAEIGPVVSEGGISVEERLSVEVNTPMMSSATNNARLIKANSPRKTALKNLLKGFAGNGF